VQAPLYAVRQCKAAEGDAIVQVRKSWCLRVPAAVVVQSDKQHCLAFRSRLALMPSTW